MSQQLARSRRVGPLAGGSGYSDVLPPWRRGRWASSCRVGPGTFTPSLSVGWDRGADRASHDADVSSIPPIIPYGGFSPVRLEGWRIRRDLPGASISLSLLPTCTGRRPVCFRHSCTSWSL